jgi:hypothetical protein
LEITEVDVDDETKSAMQQRLNAERKRRGSVTEAEGLAVVELLTFTFIFLSFAFSLIVIAILQYFLHHCFQKIL